VDPCVAACSSDLPSQDWLYFWTQLEGSVLPNTQQLLQACREHGIEVMFAAWGAPLPTAGVFSSDAMRRLPLC
jgi:nicotinamidase-related amidase